MIIDILLLSVPHHHHLPFPSHHPPSCYNIILIIVHHLHSPSILATTTILNTLPHAVLPDEPLQLDVELPHVPIILSAQHHVQSTLHNASRRHHPQV